MDTDVILQGQVVMKEGIVFKRKCGCNSTRGNHNLVDEIIKQRSSISTLIYIITDNKELELLSLSFLLIASLV